MTLDILHRLEFDAEYLMSGVIVRTALAKHEEPQIILKGSVHSVVQLVAHNRLPEDWAHVGISHVAPYLLPVLGLLPVTCTVLVTCTVPVTLHCTCYMHCDYHLYCFYDLHCTSYLQCRYAVQTSPE